MSSKYSQIRSLDELDAAIARSGTALKKREKGLKKGFSRIQSFYTPSAFVAEGAKNLVGMLPLTELALFAVRGLRKLLK